MIELMLPATFFELSVHRTIGHPTTFSEYKNHLIDMKINMASKYIYRVYIPSYIITTMFIYLL